MTLADGIRKVYMLLDEYSTGGTETIDEDVKKKMHDFFDTAQKDVAQVQRIRRTVTIANDGATEVYALPADCSRVWRVWRDGKLTNRYYVRADGIAFPEEGSVLVEYFARPQTITQNTADDYEFEVSEEAANCLPFYVAAQHLIADLVLDYGAFLQQYYQMRGALDVTLPEGDGTGGVRQTLYR